MTTQLFKWKIFCTTDSQFEYIWQVSSPTTCPVNGGHSVDTNRVSKEDDIMCITITNVDSPYNFNQLGLLCDSTNGNITVTLPKASRSYKGVAFIKKTAAGNTVTIDGYGSELIDASATLVLTSLDDIAILLCDGTSWTSQIQRFHINDLTNKLYLPKTYTKGDILVDDGNELKYLSVGTNNYIMSADSGQNDGITWTNSLIDNVINFTNSADNTKKLVFDLSSITTSNTRTITIPDSSTTLVGTTTTQTLTNKIINTASNTLTIDAGDITTGTLPVTRGGTGAVTLTSGNILQGNGTSAITATLAAPSGTILGTTDTQTLTNKTIDSTTNTVAADKLHSATTTITVSGATAPTSGQVLTATSSTVANWQDSAGGGYVQIVEASIGTGSTTAELDMNVAPTIATGTEIATLNLTPGSTSNRILLTWHFIGDISADRAYQVFIFRGSTFIGFNTVAGWKRGYFGCVTGSHLDNPATTSQITYSVRVAISPSGTLYWGQNVDKENLGGTLASKQYFNAAEISIG